MKMTQWQFLSLRNHVARVRVLDVDGIEYQTLSAIVGQFDDLDLCFLASRQINFVSTIARDVIRRRASASIAVNVI